jgi:hypothetical protein
MKHPLLRILDGFDLRFDRLDLSLAFVLLLLRPILYQCGHFWWTTPKVLTPWRWFLEPPSIHPRYRYALEYPRDELEHISS